MKARISRPTTDVSSARCVLKPIALLKATTSAETIHADATTAIAEDCDCMPSCVLVLFELAERLLVEPCDVIDS